MKVLIGIKGGNMKIDFNNKLSFEEFIKNTMLYDIYDWKRLAWGLYILNENLLTRVEKLEKIMNVNINAKKLIEPKDLQINFNKEISAYLPKPAVCKLNKVSDIFE